MFCSVMLCYVMLCYVMLCYVMLCHVMSCYVMLCYVMLCYVMLCFAPNLITGIFSVFNMVAAEREPWHTTDHVMKISTNLGPVGLVLRDLTVLLAF